MKLTPKTDVWSLGIIFYELLYKKFPWQEIFKNNNKNQNEMLKIIEEFNKNPQSIFKNDYNENKIYPDEIKNLILSMLKYNEKDRISFEELSNHTLFKSNKNRIKPPAQKTLIRSITSPESEEIKEKEIYPDFFRKETADMQDKTIKNPENTVQNIILPLFTSEILDRTIQVTPNLASMKNPSLMEDIRLNSFSSNKNSSVDLSFLASDYVEEIISSLHLKYIPIKQIQRGSLIKSGGQGHVFNAVYNKQDYAIKEIPNVSYEFLNKVLKEAHNLKKYENPRLIHIYGISYTKCPMDDNFVILYLLFELKEGDLQTFIDKKISNFSQKLKISYQIAQGIYHLHKHSTPLVHADLKPSNILIDDSMNAFITDLGISKEIKEKETTCSRAFTPGYAAPEQVFSQLKENKIDSKTDIWSLGLVYYYMFYEKKVTLEIYSETKEKKCLRIKEDLEEYMSLKELIEKMVVYESSNRIEIEDVIDNLKEIALMKGFALKSAQF